jgi:hypothetical protein
LIRAYATNVLATYPERAFEEDVVVRPLYGMPARTRCGFTRLPSSSSGKRWLPIVSPAANVPPVNLRKLDQA